jgi:hypothetical protein
MSIVNQTDIKRLTKADPLFETIIKQYGYPPNWARPQGFVSLSKIILEQQVSLASPGRAVRYLPAPPQTRTSGFSASGSSYYGFAKAL